MIKKLLAALFLTTGYLWQYSPSTLQKVAVKVIYLGAAGVFESAALVTKITGEISQRKECLLFSHLTDLAARYSFAQVFEQPSVNSYASWYANQSFLSQIPVSNLEEKKLAYFLEKRWLAKSTGFFSSIVNWVYPCFKIPMQIHPESTSHYARNPWNKLSETYEKRIGAWKKQLPHPQHFPLILTRPFGIRDHLPAYFEVLPEEDVHKTVQRLKHSETKKIVDVTSLAPQDPEKWLSWWEDYQARFTQACQRRGINLRKIIFIEHMEQGEIGGIRILPLHTTSTHKIERQHRAFLKWISTRGLSANRVELDRCPSILTTSLNDQPQPSLSKETFIAYLNALKPSSDVMLQGTIQALRGLLSSVSQSQWKKISDSKTFASITAHAFAKIQEEISSIGTKAFTDQAMHLEQIHAHISALLEILSPFTFQDFPTIYHTTLSSIPASLQPLTSCSLHSSGMTSVAGIFRATEKRVGHAPRVLYGENTYFECILIAEKNSHASPIFEASPEDWKEVDLIFAQFNPALKRIDLEPTEYRVEQIASNLQQAFSSGRTKPLTLAIDCTLDYINSYRITKLLEEFQKEIEAGKLSIICYRSGLKFDLFGMDNYCGAPLYKIHNQDAHWASLDLLLTDPALQTDRLSLQWFCLAYQHVAPELDLYRKQIFDNTRSLLNRLPSQLFSPNSLYRVVHVQPDADVAFIDIKISGPLHRLRGATLVGGILSLKCLEAGHPISYRPSLGFYHPNFTVLFSEDNTTIRLTLGVDPTQVDILTKCFETINELNPPEAT